MSRVRLVLSFIVLALLSIGLLAHDQGRGKGSQGETRVLEEGATDPPADPIVRAYTAGGRFTQGPYVSVQVNVNANGFNIVGDAANEPSIAIDPTDHNRMSIGWRQFNSVSSNFRQAGWAWTANAGQTWTFPGVLENNVFRSDPVLGEDAGGKLYYLSLLETFFDDLWSSTNGGMTYQRIAAADGGDKQWMVIDRTNSIGRGNIYQHWSTGGNNYGGRQFTRSTDGGLTWLNPIFMPNSPIWGTLDVSNNGTLYSIGSNGSAFYLNRSSNARDASLAPTFDLSVQVPLGGSIIYGSVVNPGGLSGQAWIAVDKSTASTAGYVYALCSVNVNQTNPCEVMFTRSTNNGQNWSTPRRINDDPAGQTRHHWFGTLAVAPNGRLDAVWNDTRNDASNGTSALYYSYSYDGGVTWAPNVQVSPSFNQSLGYPNQNKMGDYMGMISDNFGADVAYAATFNGEEDIYYLRIPAVPAPINPTSYSLVRGTYASGTLSSLYSSDDQYLAVRPGAVLSSSEAPIQLVVDGTAPSTSPTQLRFNLEANVNSANLQQKVELYNFAAARYDVMDTRAAPLADTTVTVTAAPASSYVNPSDRKIRARVSWKATGAILIYPWTTRIDKAAWDVLP